jgi:signal transduction histidine kinase/CheY-like chemotaxis protein
MGWFAYFQSNQLWKDTSNLYKHPFLVNLAIRDIKSNSLAMHRSLKNVILAEDKTSMKVHLHNMNLYKAEVYKNFTTIYALYLGKRSNIDSSYTAFQNWVLVSDTTIQLCLKEKKKEAAYRSIHIGDMNHDLLMKSVNNLQNFAMQKAESFYIAAEKGKNNLKILLWIIVILVCLFTIFISLSLIREIFSPLNELRELTDQHRKGHYNIRSTNNASNELGELASSFNRMADRIEIEMALKSSTTEISDALIGYEELMPFAKSLLSILLSKTKSNIGALYFLNEETSLFEPYFTVGLARNNIQSFSENTFEGEFGHVLLEKKIISTTEIPDDTFLNFPTVSGVLKPKETLNIPILLSDQVIAIIFLASIYGYKHEEMEIIRLSEKNLTAEINSMLASEKIRIYSQKLNRQNTMLAEQAAELSLQTNELQEQNAELEMQKQQIDEANRLKSEFLSSMSHELRTPLNSVIALTSVLNKRLKNKIPDDEYSYLEIIERNGKNLLALINDILDLSRIEAGKSEVNYSQFSLKDEVDSILLTFQAQTEAKNILLQNKISNDIPIITSDLNMCHHILQNLIGNAVKFTDKGFVEVCAGLINNQVHVSIKDTGIGISKDQMPHIFEEFRQVDGTSSRKYEGTGLGLAIVDKYCRLIDADMIVESELGKGSTFTFILPLTPLEAIEGHETSLKNSIPNIIAKQEYNHWVFKGKTILIIEDSEPAIIQLSEIMKEHGFIINIARNGKEALALVKQNIPDAIILDLMMPEMNGFEVLENIRGTKETAKIPVLILTAKYLSKDELKRLTENNIHQLIQKGDINKDDLLASINSMFTISEIKLNKPARNKSTIKNGKATILIVEDNADNVKTVKVLLDGNHELIITTNGTEAIERIKLIEPDLILLDISLPGMDGFGVFDEIKKNKSLVDVPVIALTAKAMKGDRENILNYGFDDYISKPIDSTILEETIKKWIPSQTS